MYKFLADVNIEKQIVEYLRESGFNIKWISDYNISMTDEELLKLAAQEERILLTNDKDFGYYIFLQSKSVKGVILFRIKGQSTSKKLSNLKELLESHRDKIDNHFIVITDKKIRFTPMR